MKKMANIVLSILAVTGLDAMRTDASAQTQSGMTITTNFPDTLTTGIEFLSVYIQSGTSVSCRYSYTTDSYNSMDPRTTLKYGPYIWLVSGFASGENTINVACMDNRGNEGKLTIRFFVGPLLSTNFPKIITTTKALLHVNATSGFSCRYSTETDSYDSMEGVTLTNSPYVWLITGLTNGEKTVYVACTDGRGNEHKLTVRFVVDIPGQGSPVSGAGGGRQVPPSERGIIVAKFDTVSLNGSVTTDEISYKVLVPRTSVPLNQTFPIRIQILGADRLFERGSPRRMLIPGGLAVYVYDDAGYMAAPSTMRVYNSYTKSYEDIRPPEPLEEAILGFVRGGLGLFLGVASTLVNVHGFGIAANLAYHAGQAAGTALLGESPRSTVEKQNRLLEIERYLDKYEIPVYSTRVVDTGGFEFEVPLSFSRRQTSVYIAIGQVMTSRKWYDSRLGLETKSYPPRLIILPLDNLRDLSSPPPAGRMAAIDASPDNAAFSDNPASSGLSNSPNPFNSSTQITFKLDEEQDVTLEIRSMTGQLVRTLVDSRMEAGIHAIHWDGKNGAGDNVASGIYLCRLKADNRTTMSKMTLIQ